MTEWTSGPSTPCSRAMRSTRACTCSFSSGEAECGSTAIVRTSLPVLTSARTIDRTGDFTGGAAKTGMIATSIKQYRKRMFPMPQGVVSTDGTILGTLGVQSRAGWILAGGRSSRMGVDKALLEIDGQPLVSRVAREAAKVCAPVSLVGDPAVYGHLGFPVIPDRFPGRGPLAGIEAALGATEADWNLLLACDMPALETAVLESLFAAGGDCALPRYPDGTVEPLCAVYHR